MPLLLRPSLTSLLSPKPEVTSPYQAFKTWKLLCEKIAERLQRKAVKCAPQSMVVTIKWIQHLCNKT